MFHSANYYFLQCSVVVTPFCNFLPSGGITGGNFVASDPNPTDKLSDSLINLSSRNLISKHGFGSSNNNIGKDTDGRRVKRTLKLTSTLLEDGELATLVMGTKGVALSTLCKELEKRVTKYVMEKQKANGYLQDSTTKISASMAALGKHIYGIKNSEKREGKSGKRSRGGVEEEGGSEEEKTAPAAKKIKAGGLFGRFMGGK